jgi:hypothetical protein
MHITTYIKKISYENFENKNKRYLEKSIRPTYIKKNIISTIKD